jgi:stage II sporulation protein AB (anti-sigma F factor)
MANHFELHCPSRAENVGLCRVSAATFAANAGFTVAEIEEIKVAVSEAVSNVVVHAYPTAEGEIVLHCEETEDGIQISVSDQGVGIEDVAQARQASFSTDPERMGLGFVFMESFSDEFAVESTPGRGTRVEMRKRREAPAEAS